MDAKAFKYFLKVSNRYHNPCDKTLQLIYLRTYFFNLFLFIFKAFKTTVKWLDIHLAYYYFPQMTIVELNQTLDYLFIYKKRF